MKIKVSEVFYSLQGEGRFVGVPSVFLRTYGCNFTCAGFGCKPGEKSTGADEVAKSVELYKTFNDLPLVETGCDSYASWHPAFKHLSPTQTTEELVERMLALTPNNQWVQNNGNDVHLVITGGEPLLGWQRAYTDLIDHERMKGLKELTFETNGTQELTKEFRHYLLNWTLNSKGRPDGRRGYDALTFSVSAKLSNSGEKREEAIRPDVVCAYEQVGYTYLKFVVATEADAQEAIMTAGIYRAHGFKGPIYLMPVGGVESVYNLNNRRVAELAMKAGLRYSDRLQVPLFKNEWGT
jgi:organic radical activating enzyme